MSLIKFVYNGKTLPEVLSLKSIIIAILLNEIIMIDYFHENTI